MLTRMLSYARQYKKQMPLAASMLIVTTLIELITPYITKVIVDGVLQNRISLGVLMVIRTVQVRHHHDLWISQLETDADQMLMTMRNLHEHVQLHVADRLLLTDVHGRRAEIRDLQALDGASKKWLEDVFR